MIIENRSYLSIGAKFGHASKRGFVQDKPKTLLAGLDQGFRRFLVPFLTVPVRLSIFYHGRFVFFVKNPFFCVCSTQDDKKHFYLLNFALYGSLLTQILQKLVKIENW
jgi:hypothetical protein